MRPPGRLQAGWRSAPCLLLTCVKLQSSASAIHTINHRTIFLDLSLFLETGFYFVVQVSLEFTMQSRLV